MNAPSTERLDALLEQLTRELDEASAGVRVTAEWKAIKSVVEQHAADQAEIASDPDSLDTAIRTMEAQRDMLALTRDEVAEADRAAEKERDRREREDRQIIAVVRAWLPPYSLLAVASVVLVPFLGLPFGPWCLVATLPAVFGFLEMRRRTELMEGRSWVVLNDEIRALDDRIRIYNVISIVGIAFGVIWFVALLLTGRVV